MKFVKRFIQRVGCKERILKNLFKIITTHTPNRQNKIFVDLFGWGGSVSVNATLLFPKVVYNEINKWVYKGFLSVQDDELLLQLKKERITREEFFEIRNKKERTIKEDVILSIWSFGNNREDYIYWKDKERLKELIFKIINSQNEKEYKNLIKQFNEEKVATFKKYGAEWTCYLYDNDWEDFKRSSNKILYKFWREWKYYRAFKKPFNLDLLFAKKWKYTNKENLILLEKIKNNNDIESLRYINELSILENLRRLEVVEGIERLLKLEKVDISKIETYNTDYKQVPLPLPDKCVIYLDPPYRWAREYEQKFDFDEFDKYVLDLKNKWYTIFVSEYNLPYWKVLWSKRIRWFLSQAKEEYTGEEKIYLV